MNNFTYHQPVKIYFGIGKLKEISDIARQNGYTKGALIADSIFIRNGLAKDLQRSAPCIAGVFSDFSPNPMLSEVTAAAQKLKEWQADFVIALGGGSALDLSKFACSMVFTEHDIKDYFFNKRTLPSKSLPLIAIPSTAGTGSEVTSVSVCNDDESGLKAPLSHKNFLPKIAVIDPEITLSVPPAITASTGIDALSHALEALWSLNNQPICDLYAIESCKIIFNNLATACIDGSNLNAREMMSLAALYAGLAFSITKTAGCHACSYPLSGEYSIPHGVACGLTLDSFVRLNAEAYNGRLHMQAKEIGFKDAYCMADGIQQLKLKIGMTATLSEYGVRDIEKLSEKCLIHPLMNNNPVKPNLKTMISLFEELR